MLFIKIHHYESEEERHSLEKDIAICVLNKGLIARINEKKKVTALKSIWKFQQYNRKTEQKAWAGAP